MHIYIYIYIDMIYKASNDDPGGLHESQRGAGLPLASLGVVDIGVMGEFPLGEWRFQWNKIVEYVEKHVEHHSIYFYVDSFSWVYWEQYSSMCWN